MTHLCVWPQWSQVTFEVPTCHQLHDNQRRLALRNNTKQPNLEEAKHSITNTANWTVVSFIHVHYVAPNTREPVGNVWK